MGLFDTIELADPRVACAAGHRVRGELQTKDLDEGMQSYVIHEGRVYRVLGELVPVRVPRRIEQGYLVIPHFAEPVSLSRTVVAYASCDQCPPVLVIAEPGLARWDLIQERHVWCEWELTFQDGALTGVRPVKVQSRDDLHRELRAGGATVLPEEDVVAKAHFAMRERRRRERR